MPNTIEDKIKEVEKRFDYKFQPKNNETTDLFFAFKSFYRTEILKLLKEEMEEIVPPNIAGAVEREYQDGWQDCRAELLKRISERIK